MRLGKHEKRRNSQAKPTKLKEIVIGKQKFFFFLNSKHLHKINVKTYHHQVRINYHTWEVK